MKPALRRIIPGVRPLSFVFGALVAATTIVGADQDPASQNQQQSARPTFRTGVNAVLVDVRVTDSAGNFISTLTKDDFQVFEDGVEQSIEMAELVSIPFDPPDGESMPLMSDVRSNTDASDGRLYVLVMDDLLSPLRGSTMRALATEFIERFVDDRDRVAIMALSGRRDLAQEFTNDRRLLRATIAKYEGGFGIPQASYQRQQSVRALSNWLADIPERRKALVVIGGSLGDQLLISRLGMMNLIDHQTDLRDLVGAAGRANASVYYIDPRGNAALPAKGIRPVYLAGDNTGSVLDLQLREEYMTVLTEITGGFVITRSNDFTGGFERLVRENSSYYLLSYTAKDTRLDDRFRRIEVRLRLADAKALRVRSRMGYVTKNVRPLTGARSPSGAAPELAEALQSPLAVSGLDMSFMAAPFRGTGKKAVVPVVVEVRESGIDGARPEGSVDLIVAAADVRTADAKSTQRGTLEDREDGSGRFLSTLELSPGRYHVRVAGRNDGSGRRGSVTYDLEVPDFSKAPLTMSGIVLASAATATLPTLGYDDKWRQLLGAPGTTTRRFTQEDELRQVVEVYDNAPDTAGPVEVRTIIRDSSGAEVFGRRELFLRDPAASGTYRMSTTVPLASHGPGEYVLTVEARAMDRRPPVTRSVPFSVAPAAR